MSLMLDALRAAHHPVALTGAGISAPSGVPTFQTSWKGRPVRDFLDRSYFRRDPVGFFELYCAMERWTDARPNAAHLALAARDIPVITQNIDGLHTKAGSKRIIEMHGNLRHVLCHDCGKVLPAKALCETLRPLFAAGDEKAVLRALRCACAGALDVDVVLYEDPARGLEEAVDWLMQSDLLLVVGTSLQTYPAAALPEIARERGIRVVMEDRDAVAALTEEDAE